MKTLIKKCFAWGFAHSDFVLGVGIGFLGGMLLGVVVYA